MLKHPVKLYISFNENVIFDLAAFLYFEPSSSISAFANNNFSAYLRLLSFWRKEKHSPARDRTCKLRMPHRCCSPKSRTWEHHRRKSADSDSIVEMYPTPMSVTCTHLQQRTRSDRRTQKTRTCVRSSSLQDILSRFHSFWRGGWKRVEKGGKGWKRWGREGSKNELYE